MDTRIKTVMQSFFICVVLSACTASQLVLAPAETPAVTLQPVTESPPKPSATFTPLPTATCTATATLAPTATPNLTSTSAAATRQASLATQQAEETAQAISVLATQQAEEDMWSKLVSDGTVTYSKGEQYSVDDFEESWAQRRWYRWWSFDYNLADFVLLTHIDWEYPEGTTDEGGCGFVFRIKDEENHLVVFLTTHNSVQLGAMNPTGYQSQALRWSGTNLKSTNDTSGGADFVLVAQGEIITAYVNGEKSFQWVVARTNSGDMGYTIVSGTNAGTGTTCTFTNTKVWELDE